MDPIQNGSCIDMLDLFRQAALFIYSDGMAAIPHIVLTIAGFDPSSGAGITADIKTIAAQDCFGIACITALTVQSTQGVRRVEVVAAKTVAETLEALAS